MLSDNLIPTLTPFMIMPSCKALQTSCNVLTVLRALLTDISATIPADAIKLSNPEPSNRLNIAAIKSTCVLNGPKTGLMF